MSEFGVTQLVSAQPAEGAVQLEQLQGVSLQPLANQEAREARREEEQGADVSLKTERRAQICSGPSLSFFFLSISHQLNECDFYRPSDPLSSSSCPEEVQKTGVGQPGFQTLEGFLHFAPVYTQKVNLFNFHAILDTGLSFYTKTGFTQEQLCLSDFTLKVYCGGNDPRLYSQRLNGLLTELDVKLNHTELLKALF